MNKFQSSPETDKELHVALVLSLALQNDTERLRTRVHHEERARRSFDQAPIGSMPARGAISGRWQARLSHDGRSPDNPYLSKILSTHWIRTLLISAYGVILLAWEIRPQ